MSTPALEVRGITRRHGGRAVVDDVRLVVEPAELVALVGPSGCGKSTLLRVIAGLERADTGSVHLAGHDVSALPPERRGVGLVFQDNALFGHLRVGQNIAFGLRHLPRQERVARVADLLEVVRLSDAARRYPHELSGGEQQRIALARALAPRPAVVLLDEPFANLDESLRHGVRSDVVAMLAQQGAAAVLVTHDSNEALSVGGRVAVMREGRVLQFDTPEQVYLRPHDRFVASFLAPTSFLPSPDGGVLVARPHDLAAAPGHGATVVACEYLGARHRYTVRTDDGRTLLADQHDDTLLAIGDPCEVRVVSRLPLHRVD